MKINISNADDLAKFISAWKETIDEYKDNSEHDEIDTKPDEMETEPIPVSRVIYATRKQKIKQEPKDLEYYKAKYKETKAELEDLQNGCYDTAMDADYYKMKYEEAKIILADHDDVKENLCIAFEEFGSKLTDALKELNEQIDKI